MAAKSRTLRLILAGDMDQLQRTLQRAQLQTKGFGQSLERASGLATKAFAAVGVAAGAMAVSSVTEFAKFDKAVREVATLMGDVTDDEIAGLNQGIRDVAKTFGSEATVVATAFYDSISAGVASAETAQAFAEDAARFATAGATDIGAGVDILTSAINAFGLSAEDAGAVSDTLFATVRAGKTTVEELAAGFSQVGPVASAAGVGLEEAMGWVAQLTLSGTPTAQAMTQVRSALAELLDPAKKLSQNFEAVAHQSFPEFIEAGGTLQEALAMIEQRGADTGMEMIEMSSRIEGAMALLGATGENADRFGATLDSVADSAGATDTAFSTMSEGIDFRLKQLSAAFTDFKLQAGEALVPALEWAIEKGAQIIQFIKDHKDSLIPLAAALGSVTVALVAVKVATAAWNLVLAANPAVTVTTVAISLAGALHALAPAFRDAAEEAEGGAHAISTWALSQGAWYKSVEGFAAGIIEPFIWNSERAKFAADEAARSLEETAYKVEDVVEHMVMVHESAATRADEIARRMRRQALDEMAILAGAQADFDAAGERAAEVTRRRRRTSLDELAILADDFTTVAGRVASSTVEEVEPALSVLREGLPNAIRHALDAADPELQRWGAQFEQVQAAAEQAEAASRQSAERVAADWATVAQGQVTAYQQMVTASREKRAALLDDLVAEVDAGCAATEALDACAERLRLSWTTYGGQMVETTSYFVGGLAHARQQVRDLAGTVEDSTERVRVSAGTLAAMLHQPYAGAAAAAPKAAKAMEDAALRAAGAGTRLAGSMKGAADDVTRHAERMMLGVYGAMHEMEASMSGAATAMGLDLASVKKVFETLPEYVEAAQQRTAASLQRLADAFGLTVKQVQDMLDGIKPTKAPQQPDAGPKEKYSGGAEYYAAQRKRRPWLPEPKLKFGAFKDIDEAREYWETQASQPFTRMARGGVVTRPTVALLGEEGPEAVIPLSKNGNPPNEDRPVNVNLLLDGNELGRWTITRLNDALRRGELNVETSIG